MSGWEDRERRELEWEEMEERLFIKKKARPQIGYKKTVGRKSNTTRGISV
jgi:hypothetical protein